MRVFLTGGTGFIGQYVTKKLLKNGHEVILLMHSKKFVMQHENLKIINGSLENTLDLFEKLKEEKVTHCIHLAWEGIPNYSYEQSIKNLNYSLELLYLCKKLGIGHVLMTGSCWEYLAPNGKISEEAPVSSENGFKAAKTALRTLAEAYCNENEIHFCWPRLFYVYGPGQKSSSLIPHIIHEIRNGRQPQLKSAYHANDFIHVFDTARAIVLLSEKQATGVYNIGYGCSIKILDILQIAAKQMDFSLDFTKYPIPTDSIVDFYADSRKLESETGFSPIITIEEGIKTFRTMKE